MEGILREVELPGPPRRRRPHEPRRHGRSRPAETPRPSLRRTPGSSAVCSARGAKEVSARRLRSAREAAEDNGCCVLLKGSDTLVVEGERAAVNSTGSVALATAGTGDVLSGVIGALLSRGMDAYEAARAGAWAHGRAAELWLEETGWPAESMVATDLAAIPAAERLRGASLTFRLLFVGDVVGPAGCSAVLDLVPRLREELAARRRRRQRRELGPDRAGNHPRERRRPALRRRLPHPWQPRFRRRGLRGVPARRREGGAPRQLRRRLARPGLGTLRGGRREGRRYQRARAGLHRPDEDLGLRGGRQGRRGAGGARAPTSCWSTPTRRPRARSRRWAITWRAGPRPCSGPTPTCPQPTPSILPGGTAYATDVGMTGCEDSIIGFDREDFLGLFLGASGGGSPWRRAGPWSSTPCSSTSTSKVAGPSGSSPFAGSGHPSRPHGGAAPFTMGQGGRRGGDQGG